MENRNFNGNLNTQDTTCISNFQSYNFSRVHREKMSIQLEKKTDSWKKKERERVQTERLKSMRLFMSNKSDIYVRLNTDLHSFGSAQNERSIWKLKLQTSFATQMIHRLHLATSIEMFVCLDISSRKNVNI